MRVLSIAILILELAAIVYGIYNELVPPGYPLRKLPPGMGWSLTLIAATMAFTLLVVERERQERERERQERNLWDRLAARLSFCLPTHERDFYSLWAAQITTAQNNIDVTHLGPEPPRNRHGREEVKYFREMKKLYKESKAQIRRVERLTVDKLEWIKKLVEDFRGVPNFSLRAYHDPSEFEMPMALSVCRIDDRYAWIVAAAEHESTANYRDLLIAGKDTVDLVRRYFHDRLWERGLKIIDHGVVNEGWEAEAEKQLEGGLVERRV